MNISTFIGFSLASIIFAVTVTMSMKDASAVLDLHAAFIVLGGTIAASLICFPLKRVAGLSWIFIKRMLGKNRRDFMGVISEVVALSQASRKGKAAFESHLSTIHDPFLYDAAQVLFWVKAEISPEELRDLLETRANTHFKRYMREAKTFRTISKFPPAFGLLGTTLGMIALLQSIGGDANSKDMIGPSMAIALVATLYGLTLSNFLFIPIAENLTEQTEEDLVARCIVVEGVMLIQADKPTKYIEEKLKSFLLPSERGESRKGSDGRPNVRKVA